MIIIKNTAPNFYEKICIKCGCVFLYELADIQEDDSVNELIEDIGDDNLFLKAMVENSEFGKHYLVNCPNCKTKLSHLAVMSGNGRM